MIGTYHKLPAPKVGSPMSDGLNETDELSLVRRQLGVLGCHLPAEEHDQPSALMQHRAHTRARSIAVDHEWLGEFW